MALDSGGFREVKLVSTYRSDEYGISCVAFDPQEDLLWAATYGGHVTSLLGPELERYTAFQAHHSDVRQLLPVGAGLLSITACELRYTSRTGLPICRISDENSLNEMHSMLYLGDTNLLVGCQKRKITTVDLTLAKVTSEVTTNAGICLLKASENYVCSGDIDGQVYLHDPHSLDVVSHFTAHPAGMSDMDVIGNCLVTSGLTHRYGQICVDHQLKVFDLRALRPLSPLTVASIQPMLLRCMPAFPSTVLLLSQLGEFQFLDLRGLVTPTNIMMHHLSTTAEGTVACCLDVAPSLRCLAFGDSCGFVHLWSDSEEVVLNPYAQPSLLPSEPEPPPHVSFDDLDAHTAPLSAAPMPVTMEPLLSDWPSSCSKFVRRRTPVIDPEILDNMKMSQFVGHAPKPPYTVRNQVPYDLEKDPGVEVPESPMMRETNPLTLIPKPYRQVEIKYSKLGIETFDFAHYNDTAFAGLEIHIPNAYCNSMLQVLYFLEPVCTALQSHLCRREFCLSCEARFLFHMLDRSDGRSCQASNFLRAFRTLREASGLGLLISREEEEKKADLAKLIQNWTSFVLQELNHEMQPSTAGNMGNTGPADSTDQKEQSVVERFFGSQVETVNECRCGWRGTRSSTELLFSLTYPMERASNEAVSFSSMLESSVCRQQRVHAWCEHCEKFKSTTQQKSLRTLPSVLVLNCQVESAQDREFWQQQQQHLSPSSPASPSSPSPSWVPLAMRISLEGESISISELPEGEGGVERAEDEGGVEGETEGESVDSKDSAVFELSMVVSHVKEVWMEGPGNLVAHIRVGASYHTRKEGVAKTQWYLFNDFAIEAISAREAVTFQPEWLIPCVLVYTRRGFSAGFEASSPVQLDPSVLLAETHSPRPVQSPATFTPLTLHELPKRDDLVGIDAEFVTLNQEEAEVKSDGTHTMLKPSQLCVARITVVRGTGPMLGSPFIDDYIATSEQVVDYLTKFSGIKPGDLDATMSSKHLTTLKASYLKLLYLLERGVVFIGHGLKKDFRVINILVPPEQVIDTVELFHLPKQRYISLKFLVWFYTGHHIQVGAHDSSEDARSAVLLYHEFKKVEARQDVKESLRKLYETGRKFNWQVPDVRSPSHLNNT